MGEARREAAGKGRVRLEVEGSEAAETGKEAVARAAAPREAVETGREEWGAGASEAKLV